MKVSRYDKPVLALAKLPQELTPPSLDTYTPCKNQKIAVPLDIDMKGHQIANISWYNYTPGKSSIPYTLLPNEKGDSIIIPSKNFIDSFHISGLICIITSDKGCKGQKGIQYAVYPNNAGKNHDVSFCKGLQKEIDLNKIDKDKDNAKYVGFWFAEKVMHQNKIGIKTGLLKLDSLDIGEYTFKYVLYGGNPKCDDTALYKITIRPPLTANAGTDKTLNCKDKTLLLGIIQNPQNQYLSTWKSLENPSISFPNTALLQVSKSGKYVLIIKDTLAGCEAKDTVEVKDQRMNVTFSFSPISCNEQFGTAKASIVQNGTPPISYSLDKQVFSNGNFEKISEGKHQVIVSDAADCRDTFNFSLLKPLPLSIDFSPKDTTLESGDTLLLRLLSSLPNSKIKAMTWSENKQVTDKVLIFQKNIKPSQDIQYQVIAESIDGCKDTASAIIRVIKSSDFFAPTAFSPNDDQINDIFRIYPNLKKAIKIINFDIYDRWDNHILHQENKNPNDSDFGWDGTFKNELSLQGVYIWTTEIEFFDGKRKKISGDVMLFF